jgi:hypothetical protein
MLRAHAPLLLAFALSACGNLGWREDPSEWYDPGVDLDVTEPVEFTDVNYDFPTDPTQGIGALADTVFPIDFWTAAYGADDQYPAGGLCESYVEDALPAVVEGVVTILPDFYFKTSGCTIDDEKYYGSYFLQDATGALFVLGDSKVAHFDMGDRIRINVRGCKTSYDLDMVSAHDVVEIVERGLPIYYEVADAPFGLSDIAQVKRVSGTVVTEPDTFGEFSVESDDGTTWSVALDSELSRRDIEIEIGQRLQATGPVIYSFDVFSVVIMRVGQLEWL